MESKHEFQTIAKAIEYLRKNYRAQPDLEQIASHVNMSKFHFQRLFTAWAGISPKAFLGYTTFTHAKAMLKENLSTLQTSLDLGLSGSSRLHDLFIKIEALTPGNYKDAGHTLTFYWQEISTQLGNVFIAETERGIHRIEFLMAPVNESAKKLKIDYPHAKIVCRPGPYSEQLKAYFSTWKIPKSEIKLDLRGTPFQLKIWEALLAIPSGSVTTYGEIAKSAGNPDAIRAAGTAIGRNPVACLIPCHRVIRGTGEYGGYRWGESRKAALLAFESHHRYGDSI